MCDMVVPHICLRGWKKEGEDYIDDQDITVKLHKCPSE